MSNNNAYHRESLASISQRRLSTVKSKSIYVLPNAFTAAALFSAFYGIIAAMNGDFYAAAIAVFFSMLFDGMDGRVARLTHTQSEFGVQMDSLADAVSFGVAPGLIVYEYTLKGLGKLGWAIAFIYCLCAILRLARFNCNVGVVSKNYFQGLPSPAAAALASSGSASRASSPNGSCRTRVKSPPSSRSTPASRWSPTRPSSPARATPSCARSRSGSSWCSRFSSS